jgi:hypothetical protein
MKTMTLTLTAVVINLIIAIADVHGQGLGQSLAKSKSNLTSSIEKEAQEQIQKQKLAEKYQKEPCLLYYGAHLVIIDLTCAAQQDSIASYLAQGYEIKAVWSSAMYLTK